MPIGIVEFELPLKNHDTGEYMTARTYTVEGVNNVDNTPRELSMGQLVMAICLKRATELEAGIIALMEEMNDTSVQLELMTQIETEVLAGEVTLSSATLVYQERTLSYRNFLTRYGGMAEADVPYGIVSSKSSDFITALESAMDSKNSFSQRKMIELQSQTSKRDQTYDMISNVLKSLNTVLVGNANNI